MRALGHCDKPLWEEWGSVSLPRLSLGDDKVGGAVFPLLSQTPRQNANHGRAGLLTELPGPAKGSGLGWGERDAGAW